MGICKRPTHGLWRSDHLFRFLRGVDNVAVTPFITKWNFARDFGENNGRLAVVIQTWIKKTKIRADFDRGVRRFKLIKFIRSLHFLFYSDPWIIYSVLVNVKANGLKNHHRLFYFFLCWSVHSNRKKNFWFENILINFLIEINKLFFINRIFFIH